MPKGNLKVLLLRIEAVTDPHFRKGVDLTKEHTLGQEVDVILRALHVHTHVIV